MTTQQENTIKALEVLMEKLSGEERNEVRRILEGMDTKQEAVPLVRPWADSFSGEGYYISEDSDVTSIYGLDSTSYEEAVFANEKQAIAAKAYAQLSHIVADANYRYDPKWVADWDNLSKKWVVLRLGNRIEVRAGFEVHDKLPMATIEIAQECLRLHEPLWRQFHELD
jgi:hypothetical protein